MADDIYPWLPMADRVRQKNQKAVNKIVKKKSKKQQAKQIITIFVFVWLCNHINVVI